MIWQPTKVAVHWLWSRRWLRRISYAVVAGATAWTVAGWLATRPATIRWAMGRIDALAREETGLPLAIGRIEVHPAGGAVVLYDLSLGDDLLTIQRVELQAELWSLLGPTRHLYSVRVEHPHFRLTETGLAAIKLKARPPRTGPLPQFRLDHFRLTGGEIDVPNPLRGLPALHYGFEVKASGLGPNHVQVDVTSTQLTVKGPRGWETGRLDLHGEVSEPLQILKEATLHLGESQIHLNGRYEARTPKSADMNEGGPPGRCAPSMSPLVLPHVMAGQSPAITSDRLEAQFTGLLNLAQASRWGGTAKPPMTGDLDLAGSINGSTAHPAWTFAASGKKLVPGRGAFLPGSLHVKGSGNLDQARLDHLRWHSPQGEVQVQGGWSMQSPVQATVQGTNLDLEALGRALRLPEFQAVRGKLRAQVRGPRAGESPARLDRWEATLKVALTQHGKDAGGLGATLNRGLAVLDRLKLDLDALKLEGTGSATLGPRGLMTLKGAGQTQVDVSRVAQALQAWKVVDLDLEGQATARAQVRWSQGVGLELDGSTTVAQPRWHGARADSLMAKIVEIRGSDLRIKDIDLIKAEGRGGGDLWLTWGKTPPGQPQVDMCYTAFRLPITEGLRAADLKDNEGKELPLTGTAGGWVRLQGPFQHMTLNGSIQVETGEAYGIKIPAASSGFWMDLDSLRMKLSDVRIGERLDQLGHLDIAPEGALALTGQADMDFRGWTWWIDLGGRLDSQLLELPGPRIQSMVTVRLQGSITSPFGSLDLPEGRIDLNRGRIFFGGRSLEGLEGNVELTRGRLEGQLAMEGQARPLLQFQVHREGLDLTGDLAVNLSPESARTAALAGDFTEDLLVDLSLDAKAKGRWKNGRDLSWSGSLDQLAAQFGVFALHQVGTSTLRGNALGAVLDINLEGSARGTHPETTPQAAHIQLTGTMPFSGSAPMAIRVQGAADLAHMKAILDQFMEVDQYSLLSELHVQGTSRFDLLARGTYADPLLDGTLSLDQGQLNLRGYQGAEDIQAQVVLKDRVLSVSPEHPVCGTLAHGDLRASGTMTWRPGGLEAYAIDASLDNFQLRDVPDGLDLQGSLQAALNGNDEGGQLKGRLQADRLSYQAEVKLADLILRSALSDSGGLTGLDLDDPLERIALDLELELRTPWSFDTNLLKLEGRPEGPFQVLGTLAQPIPKGIMVFQAGGRLTNIFPAGDMVVDRGSLTFSESRPMDPLINLQGNVSSIPGYSVNLDIRGTLSNLAIVPSSTPSLRQDEIVAILINPGNVANVGTAGASSGVTQGAITSGLASASSGLLSTLAFAPFQEQLRKTLGLDRVNVAVRSNTLGSTETEVTLGKSMNLLGQRSALVVSHKKSGELNITAGQVEWRFGNFIIQLGATQSNGTGINPSGEIRHTWSPK